MKNSFVCFFSGKKNHCLWAWYDESWLLGCVLGGGVEYKYVWDEWYGAFLSSSIMAFLSSPQILAQVLSGGFERLEDTERYGSSLASSLSPKGTERKKGSNASRGYENANLIFLEVWLCMGTDFFCAVSLSFISLLRKEEWRIRKHVVF